MLPEMGNLGFGTPHAFGAACEQIVSKNALTNHILERKLHVLG